MKEREQVKIISDDPPGYVLKYREDLLPGDRKYFPSEGSVFGRESIIVDNRTKRKVSDDLIPE